MTWGRLDLRDAGAHRRNQGPVRDASRRHNDAEVGVAFRAEYRKDVKAARRMATALRFDPYFFLDEE